MMTTSKIAARVLLGLVLSAFAIGSLALPSPTSAAMLSVPTPTATTLFVTVPILWNDAMWFVVAFWVVLFIYWVWRIFLGLIS